MGVCVFVVVKYYFVHCRTFAVCVWVLLFTVSCFTACFFLYSDNDIMVSFLFITCVCLVFSLFFNYNFRLFFVYCLFFHRTRARSHHVSVCVLNNRFCLSFSAYLFLFVFSSFLGFKFKLLMR